MKHAWIFVVVIAASWSPAEAAPYLDDTVQGQWFTGSLEAPSPALPNAGILAIEPYAIYTGDTGAFNSGWGHYSVPNNLNQLEIGDSTQIQHYRPAKCSSVALI